MSQPTEKLQKVLARAGLGSRRTIEQWIEQGRIKVNQEVAHIGRRISESDQIEIDGRKVSTRALVPPDKPQVLCYHKPVGEMCTRDDPEGRPTVFQRLPKLTNARWIAVGRLDINTAGLLLLTTDGELANRLMHPSYELEREYAVRILGQVDASMLQRLTEGVELEDGPAQFKRIQDAGGQGANHWYHVILQEGRKREVRRLWESQGVQVSRLLRIRYGPVSLPRSLREGQHMELKPADVAALYQAVRLLPPASPQPQSQLKPKPKERRFRR
jgi:23S rRNA pseudouridine2605 synthase